MSITRDDFIKASTMQLAGIPDDQFSMMGGPMCAQVIADLGKFGQSAGPPGDKDGARALYGQLFDAISGGAGEVDEALLPRAKCAEAGVAATPFAMVQMMAQQAAMMPQ